MFWVNTNILLTLLIFVRQSVNPRIYQLILANITILMEKRSIINFISLVSRWGFAKTA